jgi:hypothetical protein
MCRRVRGRCVRQECERRVVISRLALEERGWTRVACGDGLRSNPTTLELVHRLDRILWWSLHAEFIPHA